MNVRLDTVLTQDSMVIFRGNTEQTVYWLENLADVLYGPLWISIGETGDLITASQYLDLAT